MFILFTIVYIKPVYAESNLIKILNIQVQPNTIRVNNIFTISATILNTSPYPVYLTSGSCTPAFSVEFDSHVKQVYPNITCTTELIIQKLEPNEETTVSNAHKSGIIYKAIRAGNSDAKIAIHYFAKNQTSKDYSNIDYTTSKSFQFQIFNANETNVWNQFSNKIETKSYQNSPLKQLKSGIAANDIICRPDLQLLIQNQENFPICVKLNSVSNLLHRDWSYPINCKYVHDPVTIGMTGLVIIEKNANNPSSGKSYSPRNSTVVIGWNNTVSWINQDVTTSSVTSDWNLFDSGPILPGKDWKHDFECVGNYGYHSEPHPWMKGWIRVLPPAR
jgi:plastocyanin